MNNCPLSAFVDTGSSVTLIAKRKILDLDLEDQVRNCKVRVVGISNHLLSILGQVKIKVQISEEKCLTHVFLVVPDEYLSSDTLIGADLIGREDFTWKGGKKECIWGGKKFQVTNTVCWTVRSIQKLEKRQKQQETGSLQSEDNWIQVSKYSCIPAYQVSTVHIRHKHFRPGEIICVDSSKLFRRFRLVDACYIVDKDQTISVPVVNMTRTPLKIKPGRRLARFVKICEDDITYLSMEGEKIGDAAQIQEKIADMRQGSDSIKLCQAHKHLEDDDTVEKGVPFRHCVACCNFRTGDLRVAQTGIIENALLPHYDRADSGHTREEKMETLLNDLKWDHLNEEQKEKLREVIVHNNRLFILSEEELGELEVSEAHIELVDPDPVRRPLYRQPEQARSIIASMIEDMLSKDIIEESTAVYLAPIVLVSKPDGSKRMCIDYRSVNQKIKMDIHPLPRLDEMVEDSAGKKFYCTLDMKDAYFQLKLDDQSRDITTFSDGLNLYRFKRLPFGLSVSPAIFTRKMQEVLGPLVKQGWCKNYLDDVVLWAESFDQLISRLQEAFQRLAEKGMKLNVSKCSFAMKEIKFLGHIVSEKGVRPDPKNIEAVKKMPVPKSVKQIRRFIGMCNFYRRHIEGFASIASPLTDLMKKNRKFEWTDKCTTAFEVLKKKLISAPVLVKANQSLKFELHTDASDSHVGASLMQLEDGKGLQPIGYYSKKLNAAERKYAVTDREALAVVSACRFFSHYLWCKPFTVLTDHQPLTTIFKKRTSCPRMSRYILEMRDYIYNIVYKKGAKHTVPDALSRPVGAITELSEDNLQSNTDTRYLGLTVEKIKEAQREDKIWTKLIDFLEGKDMPQKVPGNRPFYHFELRDDLLYLRREELNRVRYCLVIPKKLIHIACSVAHDDSHLGERKSVSKARQQFYWPTLLRDMIHFVKSCRSCQMYKNHGAIIHHWRDLPPVEDNGQRVAIDLIDLHGSRAGYRYCLTVIDHFSRYLRVYPLRNKTTKAVAIAFKSDICRFGTPKLVLMDNGGEFTSAEFKEFCRKAGVKQGFTIPYHPRGNSVLERAHRTLKTVLAILSQEHPNTWPDHVHEAEKAMNEAVHTSLGTSPFFAFYGRHPVREFGQLRLPDDDIDDSSEGECNMKEILKETARRMTKKYRDAANRDRKNQEVGVGSYVWVHVEEPLPNTAIKLNPKWQGPYKVTHVVDEGRAYQLENLFDGSRITRAAEKLKLYVDRDRILGELDECLPVPEEESETEEEPVLAPRIRRPPARLDDYVTT